MGPLFFIVWGTKVRTRSVGSRAEFCVGCLRVSRHDTSVVEHASHVYYISGSWREQVRLTECSICGTEEVSSPDAMLVALKSDTAQSIDSLINATNPELWKELGPVAKEIEARLPPPKRNMHILDHFCARHTEEFRDAEHNLSGWIGLFLLLFVGVVITTFAMTGEVLGYLVSAVLVVLLVKIRGYLIHRRVAKHVKPGLAKLLLATEIEWTTLESALETRDLNYPKLRRHLSRPAYDAFRMGQADDGFAELPDFLVPTVDEVQESPIADRSGSAEFPPDVRQEPSRMEIAECRQCGTRVVPKRDDTCPSCLGRAR